MKRTLVPLLAVAALLAGPAVLPARQARAADAMKPVIVASLEGFDSLLGDINFLGSLANQPGAGQQIEQMLQFFTQGQGLKGLDRTKPIGIVLNTDGQTFVPLAFLPATDVKSLLGALSAAIGEPKDAGDQMYEVQAGPQKLYIKQTGGWAFLGQTPESLGNLPADPQKLIANLSEKYDVAVRVHVQNIPEIYRSLAIDQIKQGMEQAMESDGGADADLRKQVVEYNLKQLDMFVNETDQLTIGASVDEKSKAIAVEMQMEAVSGSSLAKMFSAAGESTTNFAGFFSDQAAISFVASRGMHADESKQSIALIKQFTARIQQELENSNDLPTPEAKQAVKEVVGQLMDVLMATLAAGKMDSAASLSLDEKGLTLVAGMLVVDGDKLEAMVKKLDELGRGDPNYPGIKFDAGQHAGVRMHSLSIPVPQGDEAAKIFGEKLDAIIGFGPKGVYLALGNDAESALKQALDKSASGANQKVPMGHVSVSVGQILRFAAEKQPDNPGLAMAAEAAAKANGSDRVVITGRPVTNGFAYRLEVQEGVLQLIATGATTLQQAGGAGGF